MNIDARISDNEDELLRNEKLMKKISKVIEYHFFSCFSTICIYFVFSGMEKIYKYVENRT